MTAYETFTFRTLQEMAAGKAEGTLPTTEPTDGDDNSHGGDDDAEKLDDEDASTSNALDRSKQYYSRLMDKFGRVVLDEAHKIRNPQTKIAEAVRQLKPRTVEAEETELTIHLITATPMLNRGSDYYGYLTMFWRDEFHVSDTESYGDFYFDYYEEAHIPSRDCDRDCERWCDCERRRDYERGREFPWL